MTGRKFRDYYYGGETEEKALAEIVGAAVDALLAELAETRASLEAIQSQLGRVADSLYHRDGFR